MARRSGLADLSVPDLHRELRRRQKGVGRLLKKRARLAEKLAALDAEIMALGGPGASGSGHMKARGPRPKNAMNLVEALAKALHGKTLGVTEAAEAVQKAGYKTTSPSFRVIVNQTLLNHSGRFKRVDRGQYTAK